MTEIRNDDRSADQRRPQCAQSQQLQLDLSS
jgi:hypothetical protein